MTAYTTTRIQDGNGSPHGNAVVCHGKVTVLAGENFDADNSDKINLIFAPAGTELLSLTVINEDLDSATNLTAKIGFAYADGEDSTAVPQSDDCFLASAAWGQSAATTTYVIATPVTLAKDAYITITPTNTTAAANAADAIVKGVLLGVNRGVK